MSKELEALERIKQATYFVDFELNATVGEDYEEEIAIIETALKAFEIIKKGIIATPTIPVLQSVKEKIVEISFAITMEEYEFLKGVLL